MKIMFFLPNLHGGGAEKVTVNILRQLDLNKFEITLVLLQKTGKLLDLLPENITIISMELKKTIYSVVKLRKIISKLSPDVVYSTLIRTHIAIDLALIGMNEKPRLVYRSPNSPKLLIDNNQLVTIRRKFLERAYRNANCIIAQTPEMKKELVKYHKIEADKITVILNPIDMETIDKSICNIENPFDKNLINVVAAGRITEQKGFDILIKSFKIVVTNNSKFHLFIIGEGDVNKKREYNSLIKSLKLERHITFLGFQTNPYKYFYYSDLYVLSSRWEGLPNTVLENLYLKKPIVSTSCIPFMKTLIEDGKNGFLVPIESVDKLADAILNYKAIDPTYKTIEFNNSSIENIFTFD